MSEEEIKDMILKQCLELTTNNDFRPPISAYDCVDIDDVVRTCKQLQDKKTYLDLVKENTELNQKYVNAVADYETTMFEKEQLKKQLTTYQILHRDCKVDNLKNISKIEEMENQQKEFIEYMNKTIEELECDDVDDEEMKGYLIQRINTFKEILAKYKDIIGDDK